MKTNIWMPILAPMLRSATEVKAFLIMMNRTVAMTDATVMHSAAKKVNIEMKKAAQRERTDSGTMNIMMKLKHAPTKKRPNIQCETVSIRPSILVTSAGSETEEC